MLKLKGVFGSVGVRVMRFDRDDEPSPEHVHEFSHASIQGVGETRVLLKDPATLKALATMDMVPGSVIDVPAGIVHQIVPLIVPAVVFCVFAKRKADGTVIDAENDWSGDIRHFL